MVVSHSGIDNGIYVCIYIGIYIGICIYIGIDNDKVFILVLIMIKYVWKLQKPLQKVFSMSEACE